MWQIVSPSACNDDTASFDISCSLIDCNLPPREYAASIPEQKKYFGNNATRNGKKAHIKTSLYYDRALMLRKGG